MHLIKPQKLNIGDTIATVSPSWGVAGESEVLWKYQVGIQRLEEMGLHVIAAPNSMRGEIYLKNNPKARAEDIQWAFENKQVKAVLANIGGEDGNAMLPYLDAGVVRTNPKILMGCSDVTLLHLFCYQAGLSTFYGPNLLTTIAELPEFHHYSKRWIEKVLFDNSHIGEIGPADTYSCDENNHFDSAYIKTYYPEMGYHFVQGSRIAQGWLFGGTTQLREFPGITVADFVNKILFVEDIPGCFSPRHLADYIDWLGNIGALEQLKGILIGKHCKYVSFGEHEKALLEVVNGKYGCTELPIVANMNFGHSSPVCILPYGARAEINCETQIISILESGVV